MIGERNIRLDILKPLILIVAILGFLFVCLYSNGHCLIKLISCFRIRKDPKNFEYLIYQQEKQAEQLKRKEKIEEMKKAEIKAVKEDSDHSEKNFQ